MFKQNQRFLGKTLTTSTTGVELYIIQHPWYAPIKKL
jgi:hypothetical protein